MGIFGNSKMKLFAGSQKVKKAYLGTEKIYSAGSIVTYYVDSNTYYQEEVDSDVTCLSPTTFTPTKSGWIFTGWRENNTASSSVLSSKNMGNEPISLYAVFKKDVTVYTYDDHESSNDGAPYEQYGTVYYNNGNILAAEIEAYECDAMYSTFRGYARFSSYKEAKDNIYPSYTPDVFEEEMMYITEDTYLVALYSETITLTYYNNSTTKSTTTGTKYIEMYNYESEDPKFTLSQASKSGWTARGWATSTAGNASVAYSSISNRPFGSDITLYGLYQQTITLSYNGNGATSGSVSTQSGTRYYNSYGNISNPSFTLAANGFGRTDYAFTGWDLGGTTYAAGAKVTMTNSATLYAQWVQTVSSFSHNQGVQSYTVPVSGTYKLEVWGAKGGTQPSGEGVAYDNGGNGGYAYGNKYLTAGQVIYICCGGYYSHANGAIRSAYNGGGAGYAWGGYGGGATHIATTNRGVLSNYDSYRSEVLIVAGGGGGSGYYCEIKDDDGEVIDDYYATGGSGGGTTGGNGDRVGGQGATQSAGGKGGPGGQVSEMAGSFGQGGYSDYHRGSGGGGGWYGGGGGESGQGGGGGSGYIGGVSSGGMSNGVNAGQGKAKITLIA